ncbi:hypothetical protein O181_099764, partial [Austropuccinia psidii MF-1]|nr:hypothetical protein [Austropuccinia psidii MF-1]
MSENLDLGTSMDREEPSQRGVMKSRRSISSTGFLGGYPGNSIGPSSRLGESEDGEREESVQSLISQADGANDSIHGTTHSSSCSEGQLNTPSMKENDSFDGTQAHELRRFIQS